MGSAEFKEKDEKLPKSQTETNPKPYPSLTNAEKVWIWRQRLQFEFVSRRESYAIVPSPHVVKLINLPTNPEPEGLLQRHLGWKKRIYPLLLLA